MKIIGRNIYLDYFNKEDISQIYIDWLNDKDIVKFSRQRHTTHTYKSCLDFYFKVKKNKSSFLKINNLKNNKFIGTMTYIFKNDIVDIGIMIGDKGYWNKKIGLEAWKLSINYLFSLENITKITAGCLSNNFAMEKIFKKTNMTFSHSKKITNKYTNNIETFIYYERSK